VQRRISQANADLVIGHGDLMVQDVLFLHNMVKATHAALYGTTTCEDSDHGRLHEQILCQGQWKLVVANSPMMAEELQQRYAIPPPRILTLMPGIDLRRFCPAAPAQRAGMKQAMGLRPDKFVVGFITSGSFRKRGLDQFAQTVAQLAVPVQLLIVGRDEPGPYLRGLDYVHHRQLAQVAQAYYATDVMLHTAYYEEFGMVVAEAMACGTPVITSRQVGASALLPALPLPARPDPDAFAQLLNRLLTEPDDYRHWQQQGLQAVQALSWQAYAEKFVQALPQLGFAL
jgi:UDP-glucose:(heptosyl)LPS alpha-1,3-glucosyltransferase